MDLKDFVKGVFFDVTNAVAECQKELKNGTIISPTNISSSSKDRINAKGGDLIVSYIDFEVAVIAGNETESENNIGGGIKVWGISLGGNNKEDNKQSNESVSKVKFSIPLVYPRTNVEKKADVAWEY